MSSTTLLIICAVIAVSAIPLVLKLVPPNRLYGFRTKKTLSDPQIWFRANQFAGWALLIAAAVSAFLGLSPLQSMQGSALYPVVVLVVPLVVAAVASVVYVRRIGAGNAG